MYPARIAATAPDRDAVVVHESGVRRSFAELARRADALARHLRASGIEAGDHVALVMENRAEYFDAAWAAQQSSLYLTPVNSHLTVDEMAYIIGDSGARAVLTSARFAGQLPPVEVVVDVDDPAFDDVLAAAAELPEVEQREGSWMFYSSGTTGRPKGIKPPGGIGAPLGTEM